MQQLEYQRDFASLHAGMYDRDVRARKARTTLCVLRDALGKRLGSAQLLTVGSSSGIMDAVFAEAFADVIGIDIDEGAVEFACRTFMRANLRFVVADALNLPFADESFDVVVCSQVYEHVPDQPRLFSEIHRVLKPNGICYFAATNRYILVEPHYRLWFLSWLSPALADRYVRLTGKGRRYYERLRSYPVLRHLTRAFAVTDYTATILADPERFAFDYMVRPGSPVQRLSQFVAARLPWLCPGYIWLLRKI